MYHPTTRLLTILELLQTHPRLSGAELARRLEVGTRTIRRYILMLQEMGIPIEGTYGPGGGYRLRPGFKLPPLLFTEEEAMAVVLGLLGTHLLQVELSPVAVEGARAKIYRVLPVMVRERLQAISTHLTLDHPLHDILPDATFLFILSEAAEAQRRVVIDYSSWTHEVTQRHVEPYGVVGWRGYWYMVGYCLLRQAIRLFRLDRIRSVELLPDTFTPPEKFDCLAYVIKKVTTTPGRWRIKVEFQASWEAVQHKIPWAQGLLTATTTGVLFQCHYDDLPAMARYLVGLGFSFVVHHPSELREALMHLADDIMQIAAEDIRKEEL